MARKTTDIDGELALSAVADERTAPILRSESELAATAFAMAEPKGSLTLAEEVLPRHTPPLPHNLDAFRRAICDGEDPLGSGLCRLRSAVVRRASGAIYTPKPMVDAMLGWAAAQGTPTRVVDPGAGSGRFLLAAGLAFPKAELVAVETDPLAALILRANAATLGLSGRLRVVVADYRSVALPPINGRTLFLGNPPYVRHHGIGKEWKDWFAAESAKLGHRASRLAGLHVHFYLKTLLLSRPGDWGVFVTSAEWLDVNYGAVVRKLILPKLGLNALHILEPSAMPFGEAATTAVIACFVAGSNGQGVRLRTVRQVERLGPLEGGRSVPWKELDAAPRWSARLAPTASRPAGSVELGELCRVHRGQVTGCNDVWIAGPRTPPLPASVRFPSVTRARELFSAAPELADAQSLRCVIDLPCDLDNLLEDDPHIARFLAWAKACGADKPYIARHRRAWWAVGLREPAPILATYMARRPPTFVLNPCGARHLNIAHGIYPRQPLANSTLAALAAWLRTTACTTAGRTYAGGLTKFEPRELERLPIPPLDELNERAKTLDAGGA